MKLVLKTTRYSGEPTHFFSKKIQKRKKKVKMVAFRGNSGNSGGDEGGDGVLNSNHRGMGRGNTTGDLGEQVPQVPRGIPSWDTTFILKLLLHVIKGGKKPN